MALHITKQGIDRPTHQSLASYFNLMVDFKLKCTNNILEMVKVPSSHLTLSLPNCIQNKIRICDLGKCSIMFECSEMELWATMGQRKNNT